MERKGIVFGAAMDEHFRVVHTGVSRMADVDRLRMSKYAQSELGDVFSQVKNCLDTDRWGTVLRYSLSGFRAEEFFAKGL